MVVCPLIVSAATVQHAIRIASTFTPHFPLTRCKFDNLVTCIAPALPAPEMCLFYAESNPIGYCKAGGLMMRIAPALPAPAMYLHPCRQKKGPRERASINTNGGIKLFLRLLCGEKPPSPRVMIPA